MSGKPRRLRARAMSVRGGTLRPLGWADAWSICWLDGSSASARNGALSYQRHFVLADDTADAPGRRYHLVLRQDFDALLDEPGYHDEVMAGLRRCVEAWCRQLDRPEIVVYRRDLSRIAVLVIVDPSAG